MKILTVASPWLGGSGTVGFEIAEYLSKKHHGYFISFDFPYRQKSTESFLFQNIVPATYSLFSYPLYQTSLVERIVELVNRYGVELIHAHYSLVFGESALIAKKILEKQGKKVKTVLTFHGSDAVGFLPEKPGSRTFKQINSWLALEADKVTVATEWMKGFVSKNFGCGKKCAVVPNFFDNEVFTKQNDFSQRRFFIHVSNFRKVKRPLEVVKAFRKVSANLTDIGLLMVGEGPEKEVAQDYIQEKGIRSVQFLGRADKDRLVQLYNQSLALILPSSFENFPLTVLEAAGCGVPTISTRVGGLPEVIQEGKTGFLVENTAGLFSGLAEKMLDIVRQDTWESLSQQSVRYAGQFSKEKIAAQYEKIYQGILPLHAV